MRALLKVKITHHQCRKHALEVRFGNDHLYCEERVNQLKVSLTEVEQFLAQPQLRGSTLDIQAEVTIVTKAGALAKKPIPRSEPKL